MDFNSMCHTLNILNVLKNLLVETIIIKYTEICPKREHCISYHAHQNGSTQQSTLIYSSKNNFMIDMHFTKLHHHSTRHCSFSFGSKTRPFETKLETLCFARLKTFYKIWAAGFLIKFKSRHTKVLVHISRLYK